ncbi:MAG: hypothetical protein ACYDH5_04305 [Acidimicrobiales bacterium]
MRTITTVAWLFDFLPELLDDNRIQVLFTLNGEGSAYEDGVSDAVRKLGGRLVPWSQAVATSFDLAISASHYGGLDQLCCPLLILPHGPGYTKQMSAPNSGCPPLTTLPSGSPAGTTVALSHGEQRAQWKEEPAVSTRTVIVGDPCVDRLRASVSDRERYRRALGVLPTQQLVVLSSTWGPQSLFATRADLATELVSVLPTDEYVVAAILHPNIWVGHGSWQVRLWVRRALEGGLRLIPYAEGWRGTVAGADAIIGDHGSVTLYAAALGVPVLIGAFGASELVPRTPLFALGERAPRLANDMPLREELVRLGVTRDPTRYSDLVERTFAEPGRALDNLRALIYQLIHLDPPDRRPRVLPVALPASEWRKVTAHLVLAHLSADDSTGRSPVRIALERFPAVLDPEQTHEVPGRHLAVEAGEPDHRLRESAAVIVRAEPRGNVNDRALRESTDYVAATLATYPGSRIAASAMNVVHVVLGVRGHPPLEALADDDQGAFGDAVPALIASAVYACLVAGRLDVQLNGDLLVTIAGNDLQIHLRLLPLDSARDAV